MDHDSRLTDPTADLERALMDEYLRAHGYTSAALQMLPEDQRARVRSEASTHAASRLAEMDARAHYVHELHGGRQI